MASTSVSREMALFDAVFANGPPTAGLSGSVDKFSSARDGISVNTSSPADIDASCARTFDTLGRNNVPQVKTILRLAVALQSAAPVLFLGNVKSRASPANHTATADWVAGVPAPCEADVGMLLTLVCATKATFWMTNHHTGQGRPAGYFKKWFDLSSATLGLDGVSDQEITTVLGCFWRVGHWFDTRVVLGALGIQGLDVSEDQVREARRWISAAPDLALRMSSNPAGTAKICDCAVAAVQLCSSPYRCVVPFLKEFADLVAARDQIMQNPAQYHEGAQYLTGLPRVIATPPSDDAVETLATYIKTVRQGSTLSKAIVFDRATVRKDLEAALRAVTKAMLDRRMTEEQIDSAVGDAAVWPASLATGTTDNDA